MPSPAVPFVDLGIQHRRIAEDVAAGFSRVLDTTAFILGPEAATFERAYAEYCGTRHCIGVGNGTDAIELALRAHGIVPGDEVIIPANTFVATAEAVARVGARPVLVDCDDDYLIDVDQVADRRTARTRAVIPVHLYGQMAPIKRLRDVLPQGTVVIEDAAQSQGALQDGTRSGAAGDAAATSFYPGKNLGAYGDAGAVTTDDDAVADRLRALRNHGGIRKYEHDVVGVNSRLDDLQAVVLTAKLRRLDAWNDERRQAARVYDTLLADLPDVVRPRVVDGNEHVWHLYVIRVPERDRVLAELNGAAIGAGIHYPAPVHVLPAFGSLPYQAGDFPRAETFAAQILSLPIFPGITVDQQERVVAALRTSLQR
jgi:dTDP-4-amino-4,6-dideoxygalactose transaminase